MGIYNKELGSPSLLDRSCLLKYSLIAKSQEEFACQSLCRRACAFHLTYNTTNSALLNENLADFSKVKGGGGRKLSQSGTRVRARHSCSFSLRHTNESPISQEMHTVVGNETAQDSRQFLKRSRTGTKSTVSLFSLSSRRRLNHIRG